MSDRTSRWADDRFCRRHYLQPDTDVDADRGSIAAYLVVMAVALFALAGLVLDGGAG